MRAVMREVLGLLAWGGLSELIEGREPVESAILTYQDFAWLRPTYAESSWRVILGKLVSRKLVIKTTREGRVAFQLTRQGWTQIKDTYSVFSGPGGGEWMLLLLKGISGQKHTLPEAQRQAEVVGYTFISPQVAICPRQAYSDYLDSNLRREGYQGLFLPIQPGKATPLPFVDFADDPDRSFRLDREGQKISRDCNTLLLQSLSLNTFKNQSKSRFGSIVISGLSFISQLNLLDLERPQSRTLVVELMRSLDKLMREYASKSYAWKA